MVLHKKDVIDRISNKTGLYKKDIKEMIDAFREIVYEELKEGNEIGLNNLFTIKTVVKEVTRAYNPFYKIWEDRDEHRTVKMIPSENLKLTIREYDKGDDDEEQFIARQIAALQAKQEKIKAEKHKR